MVTTSLPQFTSINLTTFVENLSVLLEKNLQQIRTLLQTSKPFTWENLMHPLEDMEDALERYWSPFAHLHAVKNSPELRQMYQACLPKLSAYEAAIGHNQALFDAIKSIDQSTLNKTQKKIIADTLLDFKLSGVALSHEKKQRFETIQTRLAELSHHYENHILDAELAFEYLVTDERQLAGLPDYAIHHAKTLAEEKGKKGWILNIELPCYLAVITYAHDRKLREIFYEAYVTRASDQGPNACQFDNSAIMDEILALRHEKAQLLGFNNYAELSLATKMAESCDKVLGFLHDLSQRSHHQAQLEFEYLQKFGKTNYQIDPIAPWDIPYLSEKKRQAEHAISQEELRPYFPLPHVMSGLLTILNRLYDVHFKEVQSVDVWHPDVRCYELLGPEGKLRGYLYTDLFARPHKRGGAWMDSLQSRRKLARGKIQYPIATLTCNFAKPVANKPATLSHEEVLTLFHELGHCLQHVLTQVDYLGASGIHGVEWDAVELPSQFFENWCWDKDAIQMLTSHIDTQETLPDERFQQLLAARNFQSGMAMLRQIEFALFDFRIHQEFDATKPAFIASILADVRHQIAVTPVATYNRFQHSFSHIFAGGYAAGYYSYKWAEVLSSDAFSRFEEEGIFNQQTGKDFLHHILETGGSQKAEEAFQAFRGRAATNDALLRHNGIHVL